MIPGLPQAALNFTQVLIWGTLEDGLGGGPGRSVEIRLFVDHFDGEGKFEVEVTTRVLTDGSFAVAARPETVLPPSPDGTYSFELVVDAFGYEEVSERWQVTGMEDQPGREPFVAADGVSGEYHRFDHDDFPRGPLAIQLTREPVYLAGRVIGADDGRPVSGAVVEVLKPDEFDESGGGGIDEVISDSEGNFVFHQAMPVVKQITIRAEKVITASDSDAEDEVLEAKVEHFLDYRRKTNQVRVELRQQN
jgi:hypothetical protein